MAGRSLYFRNALAGRVTQELLRFSRSPAKEILRKIGQTGPLHRLRLIARHLSEWRGLARKGELVVPIDVAPAFVPLVIEPLADATGSADTGVIRVEICGAVLHVAPNCSPERAAALVAALRKVL